MFETTSFMDAPELGKLGDEKNIRFSQDNPAKFVCFCNKDNNV